MEAPRDLAWSIGSPATAHAVSASSRMSWAWPVGCVLAVLYISLLPFDFSRAALHRAILDGPLNLRFPPTTPDDAVANLLVYLPVGVILALYATSRRIGGCVGIIAAIGAGTSLSAMVETLQTGLAARAASHTDILLNGVGTAIGACLGVGLSRSARAAMTQVRRELADRPFTTAASMLTLGLFLYNLAPFDFVMSTDALHASFGRAHWSLMSARVSSVGTPPFAAIASQLTGAGWFAVLGYLLAVGGRERGRRAVMSLGSALKDGLILVALVEFMQLFTRSHTFDAAAVLVRSFGVAFGAWCAVFIIDSLTGSAWRRKPSLAVPTGILAILALFQVGLLIAPCVNSQDGSFLSERSFVVQWLPFENLSQQSLHTAAAKVLSLLLTFGTLALTIRVLLRRSRTVHAGWWTLAALTLAATTYEGVPLVTAGTPMDVTTLLLAWLATGSVSSLAAGALSFLSESGGG